MVAELNAEHTPMRLLFLQAAKESTASPEYTVHRILAEHVDPALIDCAFIWQDHTQNAALRSPARLGTPNRNYFYDFGRDLSIRPKPSRQQRALMMLRQLPGAMIFIASKIRQFKPDALYTAQQKQDVRLAKFFSQLYHIPHIIHIHYPVGYFIGSDVLSTIRTRPCLFAVSDFVRDDAIEQGVAPERIRTVWNPTPPSRQRPALAPAALRAQFQWPADTPLVIAAGRLDPSKGYETLFDAFKVVRAQLPATRLLICGTSTMREDYGLVLRRRVSEMGLQEAVCFAGFRSDLPDLLPGADVFCLPTEREAFGLVFLEAMAASLPVVACRSGGVPEIVVDGETGFLADARDARTVAGHLLTLLNNKTLARRMGAAGHARSASLFAPDKIASQWAADLQELIPTRKTK
jgi:glycosyltransferase involved in cell wall biosynthesis